MPDTIFAMHKHSHPSSKFLPRGLVMLHEDRDILVVDKPAGLLTMGTDSDKTRTAYFILTDYVRKGYSKSRNRIFIVHRLDRETSAIGNMGRGMAAIRVWPFTRNRFLSNTPLAASG